MTTVFCIDDDIHAEGFGRYMTYDGAVGRLRRLSKIPFDTLPIRPPCATGLECKRRFMIEQYDTSVAPWKLISETHALDMDKDGVKWIILEP